MISKTKKAFMFGLASIVSLGLAACDGVPQATEENGPAPVPAAAGEGRDVSGLVLGPTWTERTLAAHGGGGGGLTGHVTPSAVIFAVQTRSGDYVDAIRFGWYMPSGADNLYRSGDVWGWTPWYGGGGGALNPSFSCPAGKGVIGIRGNSGDYVDRIGVVCGDVSNPNPTAPSNNFSPLWGGSGGGWFGEDTCGAGQLVSSFNVRSGGYLDGIQAICISAR
jgi:hypothetical protein